MGGAGAGHAAMEADGVRHLHPMADHHGVEPLDVIGQQSEAGGGTAAGASRPGGVRHEGAEEIEQGA